MRNRLDWNHAGWARRGVMAAVLAASAGAAGASVTTTGEFTGDAFETFEAIAGPGFVPGAVPIFGGQGVAYDNLANGLQIAFNLFSFLTETEVVAYNGNLMGGAVTGQMVFEFDTAVSDFGGFWNTADDVSGSQVLFYDAGGALVGDVALTLPRGQWGWHGWHSDTGFSKVVVIGSQQPGLPITFDDLQVRFVPAPGPAAVLAAGGLLAARRRR